MVTERDWFGVLKTSLAVEIERPTMTTDDVERMIADILSARVGVEEPPRMPRLRRRRWVGIAVVLGVLGGGATAAAVWNAAHPDRPQEGISCHATTDDLDKQVVILPPAVDAVGACAELWITGAVPGFATNASPDSPSPPLFACVGEGGGVDVFPNVRDSAVSCVDLGLIDLAVTVSDDPVVALQSRLTREINLECLDLATARRVAESIVADLGLTDWRVSVRDHPRVCIKAGVAPPSHSVFLFTLPN
jgi:hypothetical protein